MNLEQRVLAVVKTHLPTLPEGDLVQVSSFLTAECWNLINETVHDIRRQEANYFRKRGGTKHENP